MDKLEQAGNLANSLALERPYSEPGLPLGTSSFTADGWQLPASLRDAIQDRWNRQHGQLVWAYVGAVGQHSRE